MKLKDLYKKNIIDILEVISTSQEANIDKASEILKNTLKKNGLIYITGSGHSHMIAEEIFYRAGGLAAIYPILEPALMLHEAAIRSSNLERLEGFADVIFENLNMTENDTLIVISNSGRNSYPIEAVLNAKKRNVPTIAITSMKHSSNVSSRHKTKKKLYELADVVLDNCGVYGDASVDIPKTKLKMGASSTIAGVFIINSVILDAVEKLSKENIVPDIFESANIEVSDNSGINLDNWKNRVKIL